MSIPKDEIRQWSTLEHYGLPSKYIHERSGDSWITMPLIVIACERLDLTLPNVNLVPFDQKLFWEDQFLSEILEIEARIDGNFKEPSYTLKGDPQFLGVKPMSIKRFLSNPLSWDGPENLAPGIDILILGSDLYSRIFSKKMDIIDEIGIKYKSTTRQPQTKETSTRVSPRRTSTRVRPKRTSTRVIPKRTSTRIRPRRTSTRIRPRRTSTRVSLRIRSPKSKTLRPKKEV
jgi:hypothetical protein